MQSNLAINVCDVTKIYRLYDKPIDRLKESISLTHKKYHKEFFAPLERELLPFKKIKDNYAKMLLTMDLVPEEFDGVKKINVVDWLLGKNRG